MLGCDANGNISKDRGGAAATVLTPLAEGDHRNTCVPSQLLQGRLRGAPCRRATQHLQRFVLRTWEGDALNIKAGGRAAA